MTFLLLSYYLCAFLILVPVFWVTATIKAANVTVDKQYMQNTIYLNHIKTNIYCWCRATWAEGDMWKPRAINWNSTIALYSSPTSCGKKYWGYHVRLYTSGVLTKITIFESYIIWRRNIRSLYIQMSIVHKNSISNVIKVTLFWSL